MKFRLYKKRFGRASRIFTYLFGMFFIINVVRLSSPRNMQSVSSSYSFLSEWFELDSILRCERFRTRSWEPNEAGIAIIEFLPGNMWHICGEEGRTVPLVMSIQLLPTWEKMLWEAISTGCGGELPGKPTLPREPKWKLEVSGDFPENVCCLSHREGLTAGADPMWWGAGAEFSITARPLGNPGMCGRWWAWTPLTNDGEFGQIMPLEGCCWPDLEFFHT